MLNPSSLLVGLGELTTSTYREVLAPVADGGQGFVRFLLDSALVALVSVVIALCAAIPGAYAISRLRFFGHRRISLPLAAPSIMATGLFVFMIAWDEFLVALLFLVERRERWTVSLGLSRLSGSIEVPTTVLMAGSVVLTLPIVALFFLSERFLSEGLTSGAQKG